MTMTKWVYFVYCVCMLMSLYGTVNDRLPWQNWGVILSGLYCRGQLGAVRFCTLVIRHHGLNSLCHHGARVCIYVMLYMDYVQVYGPERIGLCCVFVYLSMKARAHTDISHAYNLIKNSTIQQYENG